MKYYVRLVLAMKTKAFVKKNGLALPLPVLLLLLQKNEIGSRFISLKFATH